VGASAGPPVATVPDRAPAAGGLRPDTLYAARAYFLVDKGGVVRWAHAEADAGLKRTNRELLEEIDRLE
jgi:hypothetical protein